MILRIGSKGDEVKLLQRKLNNILYDIETPLPGYISPIDIDGVFGRATETVLMYIQNLKGLVRDGVVGAKTWKLLDVNLYDPKWLCIHVTATPETNPYITAKWVKDYHINTLGWDKPGYNFIIDQEGFLFNIHDIRPEDGLQLEETTYGIGGWRDQAAINICLIGGLDKDGKVKDTRTEGQKKKLEDIIRRYLDIYPDMKLVGHNQFTNKACPCFSVPKWANSIGIKPANIEYQDPFGYAANFNG